MSLTFLQMAEIMADELDFTRPTTLQSVTNTEYRRMKTNINRAYNYVLLKLNKKNENAEMTGTITTVAGTESYSFPSGMNKVDTLIGANDTIPLRIIPFDEYLRYKSDTLAITQTGSPDVASIHMRKVWLYPVPDSAYSLTVYGRENMTELSADADTPDLPADYHRCIVEWALFFQMNYEGNPSAATQAQIAQQMMDAVRANMKDHGSEPPRIQGAHERRHLSYYRRLIR